MGGKEKAQEIALKAVQKVAKKINMEQLIYEIAGKKYLLFQIPIESVEMQNRFQNTVKSFNGIVQGGDVHKGWFSGYVVFKVLIPEERAVEFSNCKHG